MDNISIFFNKRIVKENSSTLSYYQDNSSFDTVFEKSVAFGDWCLTPVRCLFDGDKITVSIKNQSVTIDPAKEYGGPLQPNRGFLRVVASIVFIIPGIIIGSLFKGLGYLSYSIRERHSLVATPDIPLDTGDGVDQTHETIGSEKERLNLEGIAQKLNELKNTSSPTKNLVVYAEEGTAINVDPGFLALNLQKIVLVGAKIVHRSTSSERLDESLFYDKWEGSALRTQWNSTYVTQHQMKSVEAALEDLPPKVTPFSDERIKRVYVVTNN